MNNFDYKNMTPFKWFVLENFPFIENTFEAIDNYRLFSKVVEYLNKTIDNMNLTGEQMENVTNAMTELQNYVNNLNVQEEVNNKLDEMVEDGTLNKLIENIVINYQPTISELSFNKKYTYTANTKYNVNPDKQNILQGGCYIPLFNNFIYCLIPQDYSSTVLLREVNFANGNVIRQKELELNHANWISYCTENNNLYIAEYSTNNNKNYSGRIYEINYTSLEIVRIIDIEEQLKNVYDNANTNGIAVSSLNYDYIAKKFTGTAYFYDNNNVAHIRLFDYNLENNIVTPIDVTPFNDELDVVGVQGTLTHNNIAYFLKSNRHSIYSYSLLTLNNLYINNYPVRNNLGIYVGECEQISVMSETNKKTDFFAISGQIDIQYGWWYNIHCWRTNLFNDLTDKTYLPDYLTLNTVYIDTKSTDPVSDGSNAHPFHTPRNCARCSRLLARNCY